MNENLVGYLLDALAPDERREVESYLERTPEARRQMELLRQSLEPLAADKDEDEPPRGLWVRTLARVAEHRSRPLPAAPPPLTRAAPPAWQRWRRADTLVAASILVCTMLLIPPAAMHLRNWHERDACKDNLRAMYETVSDVADTHRGQFPMVADGGTVGDTLRPLMVSAGAGQGRHLGCPANGRLVRSGQGTPGLGCYSYSLGYRDALGNLHGLDRGQGDEAALPLMADRPRLAEEGAADERDNSPNHRGGQ